MGQDEKLQRLLDKQDLYELLIKYTRGMDRHDKELVQSVFHPDARQTYNTFDGRALDFVDFIFEHGGASMSQHVITNFLFEIDGDIAYGESYLAATHAGVGVVPLAVIGRYIDRFERRKGEWRISERRVAMEWMAKEREGGRWGFYGLKNFPPTRRDRQDLSYERLPRKRSPSAPSRRSSEEFKRDLRLLADKRDLHRLLVTYTHGIDRWDMELVLDQFHPDAYLHYNTFRGPAANFYRLLFEEDRRPPDGQHAVMNYLFELQGDIAYGESYLWARRAGVGNRRQQRDPRTSLDGGPGYPLERIGRWIDRFERRNDEWKIGHRRIVIEWLPEEVEMFMGDYRLANMAPTTHDRSDPSYERWD